jgi:tyrosyl-tRNA synthetase
MLKDLFKKEVKVVVDERKIREFVSRGIEKNYPSDDFLVKKLKEGKPLKVYLGIDPTGPTLHMGHMVVLIKLSQLQKLGHKIILLIGDFTATIGDPDKSAARKPLTRSEIMENQKLYKKQASAFLDFTGKNPAEFKYNSSWLGKMNFEDVLNLASKVTVQQILERDMLKKRFTEGKAIYVHEFMYPLMQGYDSVAMDVDGEVGGNDQTFNMLVGRDLQKIINQREKFVIPMKLLVDNSGSKMGKTTNNMLSFLDSSDEKYGKIMSWTDGMIEGGFELLTDKNLDDVVGRINSGENPKDIKSDLALEVVSFFHGEKKAEESRQNWITQFSKKEIPDNLEEFSVENGSKVMDVLKTAGLIKSNGEARRKIDEGAVKVLNGEEYESEHKVTDYFTEISKETFGEKVILKLGKKMVKIILK